DVARDVGQRRRPAQRARQPGARGAALRPAPQQEIQRDGIQAGAADAAPAVTPGRTDQPDREAAAAFGPLLPARAHASPAPSGVPGSPSSPLASNAPSASRSTRNRQRRPAGAAADASNSTRAASPGNSGRRNFACGRRNARN